MIKYNCSADSRKTWQRPQTTIMDGWAGFSDADLNRLKQQQCPREDGALRPLARKPAPGGGTLTGASGRGRQTVNNAAALRQQQRKRQHLLEQRQQSAAVSSDQMLSRSQAPPSPQQSMTDSLPSSRGDSERRGTVKETGKDGGDQRKAKVTPTTTFHQGDSETNRNGNDMTSAKELDEQEAASRGMSQWQKFHTQQKQMEELNKRKRQLLATAIQQRQKIAKAEAAKLMRLQQELTKMDQLLTVDVSVIRNKIEEASRNYLEAQKRYDRAEKELIEAKLDLHDKIELKDQLTEHLYTVINQNEIRKAKKLAELMDKLELDIQEEDVAPPTGLSMPPMIPAVEQAVVTHMTPRVTPTTPEGTPDPPSVPVASSESKTDTVVTVAPSGQQKMPPEGASVAQSTTIQEGEGQKPTDISKIACQTNSIADVCKDVSSDGVGDSKDPSPAAAITESEVVQDKTETE